MGTSRTRKPTLQTHLHRESDPRTRDTVRQLEEYLGLSVVVQTETGGQIPVRFNTALQQVEVFCGGAWRPAGGDRAVAWSAPPAAGLRAAAGGGGEGSSSAVPAHNDLPGVQGGLPGERYHYHKHVHDDLGDWWDGGIGSCSGHPLHDGYAQRVHVDTALYATYLTPGRLVATDGSKALASVGDLSAWIGGTANRVTVSSDGDGTVTLSGPQDLHASASPTFANVTLTGRTAGRVALYGSGGAMADSSKLTWSDPTLTVNGRVNVSQMAARQLNAGTWADVSSNAGGYAAIGSNVYTTAGPTYCWANTHGSIGSAFIGFNLPSWRHIAFYLDAAATATTAEASFSPNLVLYLSASSLVINSATYNIRGNTADGADSQLLNITAGGSAAMSANRGAYLSLSGNEHANAGRLDLYSGNNANVVLNSGTGYVTVNNRLGINCASPSVALEVAGQTILTHSANQALVAAAADASAGTRQSAIITKRTLTSGSMGAGFGAGLGFALKDGTYDEAVGAFAATYLSATSHGGTNRVNCNFSWVIHPATPDEQELFRVDHAGQSWTYGNVWGFLNDMDTGVSRITDDQIALTAGGNSIISCSTTMIAALQDINLSAGKVLRINGTQVVTARQAAIASLNCSSGEARDKAAEDKIDAVLAVLRTHGLIAP